MITSICVSTYLNNPNRLHIIQESIGSLIKTNYDGHIFIVDDCSPNKEHLEYILGLNDPRVSIFERTENGGVSKTKNTSIRLILENGEIGFLSDDDILFSNGWDKLYENAIIDTGYDHFTLFVENRSKLTPLVCNSTKITKLPHINGCFLTVTKKLIERIGYFKVMPYRFGHEHSNFTVRCVHNGAIPHYMDVFDSPNYLKINTHSFGTRSLTDIDQKAFDNNLSFIRKDLPMVERCIE